jgi:hypothetical protein
VLIRITEEISENKISMKYQVLEGSVHEMSFSTFKNEILYIKYFDVMTFSPRERNILLFKFSCKNYIYL